MSSGDEKVLVNGPKIEKKYFIDFESKSNGVCLTFLLRNAFVRLAKKSSFSEFV